MLASLLDPKFIHVYNNMDRPNYWSSVLFSCYGINQQDIVSLRHTQVKQMYDVLSTIELTNEQLIW